MRTVGRRRFAGIWFMGLMAFVVSPFVTVPGKRRITVRSWPGRIAAPLTERMRSWRTATYCKAKGDPSCARGSRARCQ
jgi:hypothetical protein